MGGNCYAKNKERGPWFELQELRQAIRAIEARGGDASFERDLLKSWLSYPEYQRADGLAKEHGIEPLPLKEEARYLRKLIKSPADVMKSPQICESGKNEGVVLKHPGGRPKIDGDDISRTTAWRRKQEEKQGVLL